MAWVSWIEREIEKAWNDALEIFLKVRSIVGF